jgi:hypothetical protein
MSTSNWLMAAVAVALISGTSTALAQQNLPRTAAAEKVAPRSPNAGANTSGALKSGATMPDRRKTVVQHGEGNRTGELQEYRGRDETSSETTGEVPQKERGELNRATEEKK